MTELRDDLDCALRSVPIGDAPVRQAMREGRRLRNRRRIAMLAGALVIAAVAAVSPSLARAGAAPAAPATGRTVTPVPSGTATAHADLVVTDQPPAAGAASGTIAQGTIGGVKWTFVLSKNTQPTNDTCYTAFTGLTLSGPASTPSDQLIQNCAAAMDGLVVVAGSDPAGLTGSICDVGPNGPEQVMFGAVAPDVAYFVLTFTDGQQLKLIPVAWQGHRYIAWVAPGALTVASLTAHLGGPNVDNGKTSTAIPFEPAGQVPVFGRWLKPGQAVPPRASGVIGHGTADGNAWSASASQGPWGTCFLTGPSDVFCVPLDLTGTAVLGGWGGNPVGPAFGSAAPGVAFLRISLSNGKTVQVTPVSVGNERLFAFWPGADVSPTGWTTYDAAGRAVDGGAVMASSPSSSATPG